MNKQRLNSTELDQISTLILSGFSLKTIANKLNKSKTTIYYHFRKVKGKTIIPLTINRLNDELIGEFIGLFAGDGSFYKTKDYKYKIRLHFSCRDQNYVDNLIKNVLVPLFNKKPMQFLEENRLNLCYNSKELYGFIKQYLLWDHHLKKTYTVRLISNNYSKPLPTDPGDGKHRSENPYRRYLVVWPVAERNGYHGERSNLFHARWYQYIGPIPV